MQAHPRLTSDTTPSFQPGPLTLDGARASCETDARKRNGTDGASDTDSDTESETSCRAGKKISKQTVFCTFRILECPGLTVSASGLGSGAAALSVSGSAPDSRTQFQHPFRMPCCFGTRTIGPCYTCSWLQSLCMKFQSTAVGPNESVRFTQLFKHDICP